MRCWGRKALENLVLGLLEKKNYGDYFLKLTFPIQFSLFLRQIARRHEYKLNECMMAQTAQSFYLTMYRLSYLPKNPDEGGLGKTRV